MNPHNTGITLWNVVYSVSGDTTAEGLFVVWHVVIVE